MISQKAESNDTRTDALTDRLRELGLQPEEAQVYLHLVRMGPVKVSTLAQSASLSRSKVYRVLDGLTDRGLVSSVYGRPVRFLASPPEDLIEVLTSEAQASLDRATHIGNEIMPILQELRASKSKPERPNAFRLLQGREAFWRLVRRTLNRAQREVRLLCTHQSCWLSANGAELWRTLEHRARDGLRVRVIHSRDAYVSRLLEPMGDVPTVEIRDFETAQLMRSIIADDQEMVLSVVIDPSQWARASEDVTLWTSARDFVTSQSLLFEALWRQTRNEPGLPQVSQPSPLPVPPPPVKGSGSPAGWGARRRDDRPSVT